MQIAMVYPSRESEKAISGYSVTLVDNIKNSGAGIESITYTAGSPSTLFKKFKVFRKYDVIHIQHEYNLLGYFGLPFFLLYFLLFLSGCKVVTTMHTCHSLKERFNERKIKSFFRKTLYFTQNRFIRWASDKTIVHANFFRNILIKEYNFNKNKIYVLPQGIIENAPTIKIQKAKRKFNLSGPVYLFMGSMIPDHGHDIIIKQADKVGKTILVVANPGAINDRNSERTRKYLEENKEIVKENHFEKFVRFDISDITDKSPLWWKYFAAADLVLLPYRGGIGSGIFAHAIAAEKPVIASNIQYFNEIAKKFGCLRIAKNEKDYPKVIKEAIEPRNYRKMVDECRRYLLENSLSAISGKYKRLYLSLE